MRPAGEPTEWPCRLRLGLVQLAHLVRVQLRLHADRGLCAEVRAQQDVDGHRAHLQR